MFTYLCRQKFNNWRLNLNNFLIIISILLAIPVFAFAQTNPAPQDTLTTPSGLKYIILEKGNGQQAVAGKEVAVNYVGKLLDGSEFDNSYKRGKPIKGTSKNHFFGLLFSTKL